jgi:hypothetical protein
MRFASVVPIGTTIWWKKVGGKERKDWIKDDEKGLIAKHREVLSNRRTIGCWVFIPFCYDPAVRGNGLCLTI